MPLNHRRVINKPQGAHLRTNLLNLLNVLRGMGIILNPIEASRTPCFETGNNDLNQALFICFLELFRTIYQVCLPMEVRGGTVISLEVVIKVTFSAICPAFPYIKPFNGVMPSVRLFQVDICLTEALTHCWYRIPDFCCWVILCIEWKIMVICFRCY